MDDLTHKIIQVLRRDGRGSFSDIARELDIAREQVAHRINPLFHSGQLRVIAAPHPRVFGLNVSAHISIKVSGAVRPVIEVLHGLASMVHISVATGPFQVIAETRLPGTTDLHRQTSMIRAIQGVTDVQVLLYERVLSSVLGEESESFSYNFDEYDIGIIDVLQQDGRASYSEIAVRVGLSLSGARTRVQRMLEAGAIQIGAIKQRSDMNGELLFGIGINGHGDLQDVTELLRKESGLEFMARTIGRYEMVTNLSFSSMRAFNDLMSRLMALATVTYSEQWLHAQIVRQRFDRPLGPLKESNRKMRIATRPPLLEDGPEIEDSVRNPATQLIAPGVAPGTRFFRATATPARRREL